VAVKERRLPDSDWEEILEAARPLQKGVSLARAREELAACLSDYPGLQRDRAELRAALRKWKRIEKQVTGAYAMTAGEWRQKRLPYNPLVDDAFQRYLLPSIKIRTETFSMQIHLRKGKLDPGHDWLYLSLLDIWINQFHGELKASTSATGGPCVRFVRVAMALVLSPDQVPRVSAVRRIVRSLGRGRALGQFRYDPVVGAQHPWRT
jgi:hypothetical protein